MAAPSGVVRLPRLDTGGLPEEATLHHGLASWDLAGTYTFIVPQGVTRLLIDMQGGWALGGTVAPNSGYGAMGSARCLHWADVTPGITLTIVVGGAGTNAASGGDSTCSGAGISLTAGGGVPSTFNDGPAVATGGSMRATSGGNVLAQGSGVGYCVIQW